ncbi:NAD(P)/FAD-dependent oxidoreductase [Ginsengibacter hankyongi]|uniref:NAD(P)/FAD-dependent oxidoreductase n=1 Tax=Ginsengibacter hankyongi TaxID=2607284 RepID=A0A5J5IHZ5_9BACT|nr:NAD(P)/FAD-dependent oxidoreductase [Ginsengibacter hankyongi]KAA9039303.1 NAD(P)/FAD-dependent oxidoreductase [Ginsengibacter hankyongi]
MPEQKTWGIIGGGMLGMTLALRLSQQGNKVTIYESADKVGGLASSWQMDGVVWDKFYHVILMSDLNTRKILKEIGLENELRWVETKTGFYSEGKLYSMSNIIDFFKFPPINLIDKFRLGLTIFAASKIKNWEKLENILVADWLTKWSGKRVFEKIWLPLLKAKLGDNYKNTSAAFIWTTIQRMYAARKSGLKKEMFGYVTGGYDKINNEFANFLVKQGVNIQYNSKVTSVQKIADGKMEVTGNGASQTYDYVISTLSSKASVAIANQLTYAEKQKHESVKYLGVICASILLKKPISKFYVTNITDAWPPFTGVIEMTALINKKEVNNKNLVYLPKYVNSDDTLFDKDDAAIRKLFLEAIFKMYPGISENDLLFWGVSKARVVFALPTINYSKNIPGITTSIGNYYIVNSAQIINGTLNVNETIQVAETKLKEILTNHG